MAIYHLHVSHGSRSGGQSAAEKSDYIQREGKYAERSGLVMSESGHMPSWAQSPAEFWRAADTYSRANARLYTEVEVGLPRELDRDTQVQLVRDIVRSLDAHKGEGGEGHIPHTWAIHDDGKGNPHAHIVLSSRIDAGHQHTPQQWFARAANKGRAPELGGARSWSERTNREWLELVRSTWAERVNQHLQDARLDLRVDHRSYARRGIERAPTMHEGWAPKRKAQMQRYNAQVREINGELAQARQVVQSLTLEQRRARKAQTQAQESHLQAEREAWERVQEARRTVGGMERDYKACGIYASKEQFFRLRDAQEGLKKLEEGHAELVRLRLGDRAPEALAALNAPSQAQKGPGQAEPGQRQERSQQRAAQPFGALPKPPGYSESPSPARRDPGALPLPPGHPDRVEVHLPKRSRSQSHKM